MECRASVRSVTGGLKLHDDNPTLHCLNEAPRDEALKLLEPLVERAPWVAHNVVDTRPFASDEDVARHLVDAILAAGHERRLALFRGHPELAGREAFAGEMTEASTSEQGRLGLTGLPKELAARLAQMNTEYRLRFGYPFILALHRIPDLETVFDVFTRRLTASPVEEHVTTLAEIASVIGARAARQFGSVSQQGSISVEMTHG